MKILMNFLIWWSQRIKELFFSETKRKIELRTVVKKIQFSIVNIVFECSISLNINGCVILDCNRNFEFCIPYLLVINISLCLFSLSKLVELCTSEKCMRMYDIVCVLSKYWRILKPHFVLSNWVGRKIHPSCCMR